MKAAIYHHAEKDTSFEETAKQLKELEEFCKTRGFEIVQIYHDTDEEDGRQRPMFIQMIKDAHRRKFDTVVVWSFRNFRRFSGLKDVKYVIDLKNGGIRFLSYQEKFFDTASNYSNVLLPLLEWVVEEENRNTSDKTKLGIERAKRKGVVLGRPKVQIDMEKAKILRGQGKSLKEIANELKVSQETLRRALLAKNGDKVV